MSVYTELLEATKFTPPVLEKNDHLADDINTFLINIVDHVSDTERFTDKEWTSLSTETQSYINGCVTLLEKDEGLTKLPFPEGFFLVEEVEEVKEVESKPIVKKISSPKKASSKKRKRSRQSIEFSKIMESVWSNPDISKQEFMEKFPELKPATAMLYRSLLIRAIQEFNANDFYHQSRTITG